MTPATESEAEGLVRALRAQRCGYDTDGAGNCPRSSCPVCHPEVFAPEAARRVDEEATDGR
jgi:hypothetical protein